MPMFYVVRREDGRMYDVELSGFYQARKFSCYHGTHTCKPELVEARAAERAAQAASGELVKNCRAEVYKGRKVPKGTVGTIIWIGEGDYGPRVGLKDDQGVTHWTAASNCRAI